MIYFDGKYEKIWANTYLLISLSSNYFIPVHTNSLLNSLGSSFPEKSSSHSSNNPIASFYCTYVCNFWNPDLMIWFFLYFYCSSLFAYCSFEDAWLADTTKGILLVISAYILLNLLTAIKSHPSSSSLNSSFISKELKLRMGRSGWMILKNSILEI